jgi:hypothetical protein
VKTKILHLQGWELLPFKPGSFSKNTHVLSFLRVLEAPLKILLFTSFNHITISHCSLEWYRRLMNNELQRMWKEVDMAYSEKLQWHLLGRNEEHHEQFPSG